MTQIWFMGMCPRVAWEALGHVCCKTHPAIWSCEAGRSLQPGTRGCSTAPLCHDVMGMLTGPNLNKRHCVPIRQIGMPLSQIWLGQLPLRRARPNLSSAATQVVSMFEAGNRTQPAPQDRSCRSPRYSVQCTYLVPITLMCILLVRNM